MNDVMLDLETMGRSAGCVVTAIGAVEFDTVTGKLGREFYTAIDMQSCVDVGLVLEPDTVKWWLQQDEVARSMYFAAGLSLGTALADFATWLGFTSSKGPSSVCVWGNGASFDNAILAAAYKANGWNTMPWNFWNDRCYRTLKAQYPDVRLNRTGTLHNALDDAKSQALHMIEFMAGRAVS